MQAEARKYSIDTICAHQYRDQLDALNQGSTLNVGNLICFRISGKDSAELAACFDNTPPEPELERQSMLYPTSREGIYRTGDKQEFVLVPGKRRLYADVAGEQANVLANLPNYHAKARLIAGSRLAEYTFASLPPPKAGDTDQATRIRMRSRLSYGRSRQQVEEGLRSRGTFSLPSRGKYDE